MSRIDEETISEAILDRIKTHVDNPSVQPRRKDIRFLLSELDAANLRIKELEGKLAITEKLFCAAILNEGTEIGNRILARYNELSRAKEEIK